MSKTVLGKKLKLEYIYELAVATLLIVNVFLMLYFLSRLNEVESLTRETQAQAQELINALNNQ